MIVYGLGTALLALVVHFVLEIVRLVRKRIRDAEALKDFPGPKGHWLMGSLNEILKPEGRVNFDIEMAERFPKAALTRFDPFHFHVRVHHPETIKAITNTAEPKDHFGYDLIKPWIGDGLLVSSGHKWLRNRRLLTPAFHCDLLKTYVTKFSRSAHAMTRKLLKMLKKKPEQPIELFEHISLMTLDSLMKCIFGVEKDCQAEGFQHPYIQGVCELSYLTLGRMLFFPYLSDVIFHLSWSGYKFRRACRIVHRYSRDVINIKKQEMAANEDQPDDSKHISFMDMLLRARDEDGNGLTDEEIRAEVDTFMFEGHDTTASGISWLLYNLARHPEYQTKCRAEVNSVLTDREQFTWDDMKKLPFLTMCVKESLRLHPPVPLIGRELTKPLTFPDGRTVPTGTWICISIMGCHHNPEVWKNPTKYDPYRFTPENSQGRSPHAFIPFSAGPRNCIGQNFALYEMKASVGQVLRHFELFEEKSKSPIKDAMVVLRATDGLHIRLKAIEH